MTTTIKFTKMHGAGNDYIYVNTLLYNIPNPKLASIKWSAPHTGIGSDGLVLIGKPSISDADFSMRIYNADGSEALMCGNASRCIGKYLYEKGITDKKIIKLQTLSGIKILKLHIKDNLVSCVTVDMLEPQLSNRNQLCTESGSITEGSVYADGKEFKGTFVSMGNPHFVIFVENIYNTDVSGYGSLLERNALFPQRCNIEFAEVKLDGTIRTRVWERGSGITMACGTGACATAVAASLTHRTGRKSSIVMDGGTLDIEWNEKNNHVYMTGPAAFAFEGEIELPTECDINDDKLNKQ
jgi:diaminopimelate epimerase